MKNYIPCIILKSYVRYILQLIYEIWANKKKKKITYIIISFALTNQLFHVSKL